MLTVSWFLKKFNAYMGKRKLEKKKRADEKLKMEEQLEGIGNSTIEVSNDLMNLFIN